MTTAFPETWLPVTHSYQVSDRGHIRRRPKQGRRTARLSPLHVDAEGYQNVTLIRGQKERTVRVDTLVCQAFHGKPDKGMVVQHIDGVTWNDWSSNLRWEYQVVATEWYSGPIGPACRSFYRHGPYTSKTELLPCLEYGDVVVAFNEGRIASFEFVFGRDLSNYVKNPFDMARYWRATVNSLMQVERSKGMDMMLIPPDFHPYDAAQSYRSLAAMHPEYMWAHYLLDAAFYIERMADCIYKNIELPPSIVVPIARLPMKAPQPVQAPAIPAPISRRPMTAPPVAPPPVAPQTRRRTVPPAGLFNKD